MHMTCLAGIVRCAAVAFFLCSCARAFKNNHVGPLYILETNKNKDTEDESKKGKKRRKRDLQKRKKKKEEENQHPYQRAEKSSKRGTKKLNEKFIFVSFYLMKPSDSVFF